MYFFLTFLCRRVCAAFFLISFSNPGVDSTGLTETLKNGHVLRDGHPFSGQFSVAAHHEALHCPRRLRSGRFG